MAGDLSQEGTDYNRHNKDAVLQQNYAKRRLKQQSTFLVRIYMDVLLMEFFFCAFTVSVDFLLSERHRYQTFRVTSNQHYTQYLLFLLFFLTSSMTVFKARKKHLDGLTAVDLFFFAFCFSLGHLLIIFLHYPCKSSYWEAVIVCVVLTFVNLAITTIFVVLHRSGPPTIVHWLLITLCVVGVDFILYYTVKLVEISYVSATQFTYGSIGSGICQLALVIISETIFERQAKRLMRKTKEPVSNHEPFLFATFHTFLSFMFIQLTFAMALHYERMFFSWYQLRDLNFKDNVFCVYSIHQQPEENSTTTNGL